MWAGKSISSLVPGTAVLPGMPILPRREVDRHIHFMCQQQVDEHDCTWRKTTLVGVRDGPRPAPRRDHLHTGAWHSHAVLQDARAGGADGISRLGQGLLAAHALEAMILGKARGAIEVTRDGGTAAASTTGCRWRPAPSVQVLLLPPP